MKTTITFEGDEQAIADLLARITGQPQISKVETASVEPTPTQVVSEPAQSNGGSTSVPTAKEIVAKVRAYKDETGNEGIIKEFAAFLKKSEIGSFNAANIDQRTAAYQWLKEQGVV